MAMAVGVALGLVRQHPFLFCFLLLSLTPPFLPLLLFFSPLLASTALFVLAIISLRPHLDEQLQLDSRGTIQADSPPPPPASFSSSSKTTVISSSLEEKPISSSKQTVALPPPPPPPPPTTATTSLLGGCGEEDVLWPEWVRGLNESSREWVAKKMKEESMAWLPSSSPALNQSVFFESSSEPVKPLLNLPPSYNTSSCSEIVEEEEEEEEAAKSMAVTASSSKFSSELHSRNRQSWLEWLKGLDEASRAWIEPRLTEHSLWNKPPNQETILSLVECENSEKEENTSADETVPDGLMIKPLKEEVAENDNNASTKASIQDLANRTSWKISTEESLNSGEVMESHKGDLCELAKDEEVGEGNRDKNGGQNEPGLCTPQFDATPDRDFLPKSQSNRKAYLLSQRRILGFSSARQIPLENKNGHQDVAPKEASSSSKGSKLRWNSPNKESEANDAMSSMNLFDDHSDRDDDVTNPFAKSP